MYVEKQFVENHTVAARYSKIMPLKDAVGAQAGDSMNAIGRHS